MEQHRITEQGFLHDANGHLNHKGYATSPLLTYERARIKASLMRIKEWDYYYINDDRFGVAVTVGDMGFAGMLSASLVDFERAASVTDSVITPFPLGRFLMPASSDTGDTFFENNRVRFDFDVVEGVRTLQVNFKRFGKTKEELEFFVRLDEEPRDSMVIVTPWAEDPQAFYYNRKIIGMRASGSLRFGCTVHGFKPDRSFGLLDWGRGVWTRDNTWYWGFAQGWQDGRGGDETGTHLFGLNMGYGFGDTSAASENMAFLDGVATKLGDVHFEVPPAAGAQASGTLESRFDLMEPWRIVDDEGRVNLVFTPSQDRSDFINAGVVMSDQHQMFGTYSGTVNVDTAQGPRDFAVTDLRGAAEIVHNRY